MTGKIESGLGCDWYFACTISAYRLFILQECLEDPKKDHCLKIFNTTQNWSSYCFKKESFFVQFLTLW